MNSFVVTTILVLAAAAAGSNDVVVTTGRSVGVDVGGRILEMKPIQVTIRRSARAVPRTVNYYAFTDFLSFGEAYSLCKSLEWNVATPKTSEDQRVLAAVMVNSGLATSWIGATCSNNRWTWLADRRVVTYNNFKGNPTVVPSCGSNPPSALMIYGDYFAFPIDEWFTWDIQYVHALHQVICQV